MTKKDFIKMAAHIRADLEETRAKFPTDYQRMMAAAIYAADTFSKVAKADNPGFNGDTFMKACGLTIQDLVTGIKVSK